MRGRNGELKHLKLSLLESSARMADDDQGWWDSSPVIVGDKDCASVSFSNLNSLQCVGPGFSSFRDRKSKAGKNRPYLASLARRVSKPEKEIPI